MPRYIDADELLSDKYTHTLPTGFGIASGRVIVFADDVDKIPAADVQEVKHSKWIPTCIEPTTTYFQCSLCERTECLTNDYFGTPTDHVAKILPYCHCGAKMDSK